MVYNTIEFIIIGLVATLLWTVDYWRIGRKPVIIIPSQYYKSRRYFRRWILFLIGVTGWILISISLGGPREPLGKRETTRKVNDVFFVIDVSGSMRMVDFIPNRLEAAKETIEKFIKMRPRDRIGVIVFAEKAFTLLPLSTDNDLISKSIKDIKIGYLGIGQGTNIGDAIGLAVARSALSSAKTKTIILLTDGVTMTGNLTPIQSAREAAAAKIKIHVIGLVNDSKKALMPLVDRNGKTRYDRWGKRILKKAPGGSVDKQVMREVATLTGGTFHIAGDIKGLEKVFHQINKLDRGDVKSIGEVQYKEFFWIYLFYGVLFVFVVELVRRFIMKEGD